VRHDPAVNIDVQEVVEKEKAANFRLQPLPDVFESLLCPTGDPMDVAASEAAPTDAASMDEDDADAFESAAPTPGSTSAAHANAGRSSGYGMETPDASYSGGAPSPEQTHRPPPNENINFVFLGGSYRCACMLQHLGMCSCECV
jgi:hypothetical protein